jgi:hypothetical protein
MKKLLSLAGVVGFGTTTVYYFHEKHKYDKDMFDQINLLLSSDKKLSGVYLMQRQPFGLSQFITSLLPYHQSIKIVNEDGSIRHVGLAKVDGTLFAPICEFVLHKGGRYETLNKRELCIPIEAWVDYKRKFGHFPSDIDVNLLNEITMTRSEVLGAGVNQQRLNNLYKVQFGLPSRDLNGDFILTTCRSAVMNAVRTEEVRRLNVQTVTSTHLE